MVVFISYTKDRRTVKSILINITVNQDKNFEGKTKEESVH